MVLVTGAYGGIGSAVCRLLARAGYCVVLLARSPAKLDRLCDELEQIGAVPPVIYPVNLECATPDDFAILNDRLIEAFGKLDGLIHCAASFQGLTPLAQTAPDQWLRMLHVNLSAPVFLTVALQPALAAANSAQVIFTGEDMGTMGKAYWGPYGVSKQGLKGVVSILANEWEASGINVSMLNPPPTATGIRALAYPGEGADKLADPMDVAQLYVRVLTGRGLPAD